MASPSGLTPTDDISDTPKAIASDAGHDFDEDKCRNVLVRYCAHIPRNYQYRDGVRLVFLVLRDHLGDEHLGRAGGVLYEMIEVDCHHTHDKGAAFQRWRHDHMNRHVDLELPHVPHLTTVTSTITPTATLAEWRLAHPQRYSTRLSDYSPRPTQDFNADGCVRTRKSWMIEYTMYVSSRDGGTRPFRTIEAKDYHESQWNCDTGRRGRLVEEKLIDLCELSLNSESEQLSEEKPAIELSPRRHSSFSKRRSDLRTMVQKVSLRKKADRPEKIYPTPALSASGTVVSLLDLVESKPASLVDGEIPNAIFARKFGLFTDDNSLPPSIRELPVAEDKAMDVVAESSVKGIMTSLGFRGPLTPQLWFDSGIEYRWNLKRR